MIQANFGLNWPCGFRGEDFLKVYRWMTDSINDGLPEISKMKYRNQIPELGTTISGFADN
jgi:hypothetical protein